MNDLADRRTDDRRWSRSDTVAISLVTALACGMRGIGLTRLPFIYSDELFYAREACNYVYRSAATCGIPIDAVSAHPPLGKWLISLGVRAIGWEPLGWRIASLIAGTATVALLYVLARRLFGSTTAAPFSAGLLAIDFLHVVQSRIAMLDVFLTLFVLAAFTFVVIDRSDGAARAGRTDRSRAGTVPQRPWLAAAGAVGGAAVATKWIGVLGLLGSAGLAVIWMIADERGSLFTRLNAVIRRAGLTLIVAFGLVPGLVYAAAYGPRVDGRVLAAPWERGSWARGFARQQLDMLEFHRSSAEIAYLGTTNPFASPAWSWPLVRRPMIYYSEPRTSAGRETVMAMGSPLVWWTALASLGALALGLARRRYSDGALVAVLGFVAVYAPLVFVSLVRPATFIYYMLPAVPFMCLAIAAVAMGLQRRNAWRGMFGFWLASAAMFAFFYPVLTAAPLAEESLSTRQWFRDCDAPAPTAPPTGWCWR